MIKNNNIDIKINYMAKVNINEEQLKSIISESVKKSFI